MQNHSHNSSVPLMNLLKSAPASPATYRPNWDPEVTGSAIGKLTGKDFEYVMRQKHLVIGRHSSTHGDVDINLGHSTLVSRRHIEISFDNPHFYFKCEGKNGIFVDDEFQRKSDIPIALPPRCWFRFPSTQIKILFESLFDEFNPPSTVLSRPPSPAKFSHKKKCFDSLEIHIPDQIYHHSSALSPSGTISAANSCPASPRPGGLYKYPHVPNDLSYVDEQVVQTSENEWSNQESTSSSAPFVHDLSGAAAYAGDVLRNKDTSAYSTTSNDSSPPLKGLISPGETTSILYTYLDHHKQLASRDSFPRINSAASNGTDMSDISPGQIQMEPYGTNQSVLLEVESELVASASGSENPADKPPYSYAQLIIQSIASAPDRQLTLSGIYSFIMKNYPYYRGSDKGWQNSIRHNLSLNRYFQKVPRSQDEPGKGSFWKIEENSESKLLEQAFKKRRSRGIHGFRSAYASSHSRSAPTSPTTTNLLTPEPSARGPSPMSDVSGSVPYRAPALSAGVIQLPNTINISPAPAAPTLLALPISAVASFPQASQGSVITVVRSDSSGCAGGTVHILPRILQPTSTMASSDRPPIIVPLTHLPPHLPPPATACNSSPMVNSYSLTTFTPTPPPPSSITPPPSSTIVPPSATSAPPSATTTPLPSSTSATVVITLTSVGSSLPPSNIVTASLATTTLAPTNLPSPPLPTYTLEQPILSSTVSDMHTDVPKCAPESIKEVEEDNGLVDTNMNNTEEMSEVGAEVEGGMRKGISMDCVDETTPINKAEDNLDAPIGTNSTRS